MGVDRSIKWVPEGGEDYQAGRISNSYLQRYLSQFGGEEKIRHEETITTSVGPRGIHKTRNRANRREASDTYPTEERRNKPSPDQDGAIKERNSTMFTPENPRKTEEGESHTDANNTHATSTRRPGTKVPPSTNGPTKKSKMCVIL